MLTLRASAALLRAATSVEALAPIARAAGFVSDLTPLDAEACDALGLGGSVVDVALANGPGTLRALLFATDSDDPRGDLTRTASRLCARAPHALWLLLAVQPAAHRVLIGAPTPARRGVKVAALVVDRGHVMDSDAETLRMLVASQSADDLATHGRFVEVLGRDALSRSFFRKLEACVDDLGQSARIGTLEARREIALLYASRLLFLAFLESKGWLDADAAFLARTFDGCMAGGGEFHQRVLLPLFFGTLNTPATRRAPRARRFGRIPFLNGGLFTPTPIEKRFRAMRFSDESCGRFFGELLSRYRFTSREETSSFEEAAIDPEMLGRTFECLMAADSRRASGAFYTPHELVERVTACGLESALAAVIGQPGAEALVRGAPIPGDPGVVRRALGSLRILDPACGSGAFLVHALDRVSLLLKAAGDPRPTEAIRRQVLSQSVFGVDVNPTAVWLCQLRLWLSIVIDSRDVTGQSIPPLPNLDRNVRVGDSLSGSAFGDMVESRGSKLGTLRNRYARASGRRKATLARMLDREERRLVITAAEAELKTVSAARRDMVTVRRGRDLFGGRYQPSRDEARNAVALRQLSLELRRRIRRARAGGSLPFGFAAHFADVASAGGFSLVIGNPPWVRPHHVDASMRDVLRQRYVVASAAPWSTGADAAGAGRGFGGQVDLAAVFVERSLKLLSERGALSLLLPSKLWRSLSSGGLRALVSKESRVVRIEDYSDVPAAFDAAVYPGLLVASRRQEATAQEIQVSVLHRARLATTWTSRIEGIAWDETRGSPWILIPPDVRRAFDLVRARGVTMSESRFGRPHLGVKCGLNDAYIVQTRRQMNGHSLVAASNGREAVIDSRALRPVLRGESVRRWNVPTGAERIVWTHGNDGSPVAKLDADLSRWFAPYRRELAARADARNAFRWWMLFRTEGSLCDRPRVVWADIARSVRAAVLCAGDATVPLNTCYVARCPDHTDALALCAILNSPLASAWLSVIAEPARGGYRRYLGWTMSLFPLPADWESARAVLAPMAARAIEAPAAACDGELLEAVIATYGLRRRDVDPLLAWSAT